MVFLGSCSRGAVHCGSLVDRLLDPAAYQRVTLDVRGSTREVMGYVLDRDRVIWGMTERVLTPLVQALRKG